MPYFNQTLAAPVQQAPFADHPRPHVMVNDNLNQVGTAHTGAKQRLGYGPCANIMLQIYRQPSVA